MPSLLNVPVSLVGVERRRDRRRRRRVEADHQGQVDETVLALPATSVSMIVTLLVSPRRQR